MGMQTFVAKSHICIVGRLVTHTMKSNTLVHITA